MTIRRLLLSAFLLVSLLPATALTLLAFERSRSALLGEIETGVRRSAGALSADVDRLFAERLLNATTWNHLEVMQDLRINDVDKRLSSFLAEMKHRYGGLYRDLLAVDLQGRVVASSLPGRIGSRYPASERWFQVRLPGGLVSVDRVHDGRLRLRAPIDSAFTSGPIGELVLELDWSEVEQKLDAAAGDSRDALILDARGHVVVASARLRARGAVPGSPAAGWLNLGNGVTERRGTPWIDTDLLVGGAPSPGAGVFPGFGWTTLLLQSRDAALAPVHRMALAFSGLLSATALVTVLASLGVAGRIARPITALTEFTRHYLQPERRVQAPPAGPGEVGELNRSFVQMIEALQRSQDTLAQASKLAALGEITALMAHEVRTPLGILRSSAQMLRLEPQLSEEGAELVRIIESETARLNRLVASMLDSARTRPPQRQPEDVHAIIGHALTLLASQLRGRRIRQSLDLGAAEARVDCDAEQITQVLLNLLMNALQILPPEGRIAIRTYDEHERLIIAVADDGPGIPAEERQRIFEPFVFKREGGVGLGLAVVRQILRQHGGDIVAEASPLGGAQFRLWLPRTLPL